MKLNYIQNQLIYSTIRIVVPYETGNLVGTGFFVMRKIKEDKGLVYLATNKHVVKGAQKAHFQFCAVAYDGSPLDDKHILITVNDLPNRCIMHPDNNVDLCFIDLMDVIEEKRRSGEDVFFRAIGEELFISQGVIDNLTAIENVVMIGYPEGFFDKMNNKPVVRKGLTATSIGIDYNGMKKNLWLILHVIMVQVDHLYLLKRQDYGKMLMKMVLD